VSPELASDTMIDGRYRVIRRLGSGGMADVYCAVDEQLGREVALKLLYPRFAQDQEFVERFRREASSAAGLAHQNVVSVYDRGEWDGTYYIAMEYLEGRSLKTLVAEEGALHPVRAIDLVAQILAAARFAHARGIIHRDLKPQNVIVAADDAVTVTDFGIARAGASDMTETGSIMGTAQYLSPEQAQGHAVSGASDVYSIGIVLYELLTGTVPFDGPTAVTIALKQVSEAPWPPSAINPEVSSELDSVVLCALAKDPSHRYPDADAFLSALQSARAGLLDGAGASTAQFAALPVAADAYAPYDPLGPAPERRRRWWPWLLGALLVAALVAAAILIPGAGGGHQVPNLAGQPAASATTVLTRDGFRVLRRPTPSSTVATGLVISTEPPAGAQLARGATVTLLVSTGPATATVPNVALLGRQQATRELRQAGFSAVAQRAPSDTVARDHVISTTPAALARVPVGSQVTLEISTGPGLVTVAGVTGQTLATATATLQSAGFMVATMSQVSGQAPGTVLDQSPAAGASLPRGATVTLTVAKASDLVTVPDVTNRSDAAAVNALSAAGLTPKVVMRAVSDPARDGRVVKQSPSAGQKVAKGSTVTITLGRLKSSSTPTAPGQTTPTPTPTTPGP